MHVYKILFITLRILQRVVLMVEWLIERRLEDFRFSFDSRQLMSDMTIVAQFVCCCVLCPTQKHAVLSIHLSKWAGTLISATPFGGLTKRASDIHQTTAYRVDNTQTGELERVVFGAAYCAVLVGCCRRHQFRSIGNSETKMINFFYLFLLHIYNIIYFFYPQNSEQWKGINNIKFI